MLDVNNGTSSFCGQNDGQADDPERADDRARQAAEAPDHRDRDQADRVVDEEEALRRPEREVHRTEESTAEAGDESADRERDELGARGRHRHRRGGELVLAHAHDHAADPGSLQVPDEQQHQHEDDQHEVVVRAVLVRELERSDVDARDLHGGEAGGEERPVEEVDLRGDGERERADREQEPADAESPDADAAPRPGSRRTRRAGPPRERRSRRGSRR